MIFRVIFLSLHILLFMVQLSTKVSNTASLEDDDDSLPETAQDDAKKWAAHAKGSFVNRRASYFFDDPDKTIILDDYNLTFGSTDNNTLKRKIRIKLGRIGFYLRVAREFLIDPRTRRSVNMYSRFPEPFLKKLHPVLEANCSKSFLECVISSEELIRGTYWFSRFFFDLNQNTDHADTDKKIRDRFVQQNVSQNAFRFYRQPFNDLEHQFEYTMTLSYYFCWYTMLRLSILAHLPYCSYTEQWNSYFASENTLLRDDFDFIDYLDPVPFRCAQFSFCPDPCCFRTSMIQEDCDENPANPCRTLLHKKCILKPDENDNFVRMIQNDFNKSCKCNAPGFRYEPSINECFDEDECESTKRFLCTEYKTTCMNTVGSYFCSCIQGYSMENKTCVLTEPITELKRQIRNCVYVQWSSLFFVMLSLTLCVVVDDIF